MIRTGALVVFSLFSATLRAEIYDVRLGTIEADANYRLRKGGTDSLMGTLTRPSDGFTVNFDIGGMAGIHVHEGKSELCTFYREHLVNRVRAWTCVEKSDLGRRITTTIGEVQQLRGSPANFWATIRDDAELVEFLLLVHTYRQNAL